MRPRTSPGGPFRLISLLWAQIFGITVRAVARASVIHGASLSRNGLILGLLMAFFITSQLRAVEATYAQDTSQLRIYATYDKTSVPLGGTVTVDVQGWGVEAPLLDVVGYTATWLGGSTNFNATYGPPWGYDCNGAWYSHTTVTYTPTAIGSFRQGINFESQGTGHQAHAYINFECTPPPPTVAFTSLPPANPMYYGQGFTVQAHGNSPGYLSSTSMDISVNGGGWVNWSNTGGGNGYDVYNTVSQAWPWGPGTTVQFRTAAGDSIGQSSGYVYSGTYSTGNRAPYFTAASASPSTINFGQTTSLSYTGHDDDNDLYVMAMMRYPTLYGNDGQWRKPAGVDYSRMGWNGYPADGLFTGASFSNDVASGSNITHTITDRPPGAGQAQYGIYVGDSNGGVYWAYWLYATVNKATPNLTALAAQSFGNGNALTAAMLNVSASNPYSGLVAAPTGAVTYSASGYGAVGVGTVLPAGTYTVTATYPGDGNYNATTTSAVFRVAANPSTTNTSSLGTSMFFGQTTTITATTTADTARGDSVYYTIIGVNTNVPGATYWNNGAFQYYVNWFGNGVNPTTYSFTPTAVGSYTFTGLEHTVDFFYWAAWSAGVTVVVNKTTPTMNFNNQSFGGTMTLSGTQLNASATNPYNGSVAAPSGTITYAVVGASGTGAYPTSGAVAAGTKLYPGTYTIRATYPGDGNYNATTKDVTFTVSNSSPTESFTVNGSAADAAVTFGQSVSYSATVSDPDNNLASIYLLWDVGNGPGAQWTGVEVGWNFGPNSTGWTINNSSVSSYATYYSSLTKSGTLLPYKVGSFLLYPVGYDSTNAIVGLLRTITVSKATPTITFGNQTVGSTITLSASQLNAAASNPYSGAVTAPTGTITYSIVGASGTGASPTTGAVNSGTVLYPGTYTVRASYPGDANYNATTKDATFTVTNSAPTTRARAVATSITFGQSMTFYTDGWDADNNLVQLLAYVRGPGTYVPGTWNGWVFLQSANYSYSASATLTTSYTPTAAGNWQFNGNAVDAAGVLACFSNTNVWRTWNVIADSTGVVAADFTVSKATPTVGNWINRNIAGGNYTFASTDQSTWTNPYSGSVTAPSGTTTYSIVSSTGAGATAAGAVSVGTVLNPGTYTLRATYPGDSNYLSTTSDVTWTVLPPPPVFSSATTSSMFAGVTGSYQSVATSYVISPTVYSFAWVTACSGAADFNVGAQGMLRLTPTNVGTYSFTVTATNSGGSASRTVTLTVLQSPTTTTGAGSSPSAVLNLFPTDSITLTGSTNITVNSSPVATPTFTVQSYTNISSPTVSAGNPISSPFVMGGSVVNADGSSDKGSAVGTMVILVSYPGSANYGASSSTITLTLKNSSYQSNIRARAYPPAGMGVWAAPSAVAQDTLSVLRAR